MSGLNRVIIFFIHIIFDLAIWVLLLRLFLQFFHAPKENSICQVLVKVTKPIVQPVRSFLPLTMGIDFALVVWAFVFATVKYLLLFAIVGGFSFGVTGALVLAITTLLTHALDIFFYAILIHVILSWVSAAQRTALHEILPVLTEPLLSPVRKVIPPLGGFDLSPIVVMIVLKAITLFLE